LVFEVLEKESSTNTAFLASNTTTGNQEKENVFSPLLVLTQVNNNAQNHKTIKKESGLYHFAILLPERRFLASFLRHIQKNLDSQYYEGMADHGVSESIYIHDPDFNGIEFYRDRLPSEWRWNGEKVHMVTEPLDVKDMLTQNPYEMWRDCPLTRL
jgi:catechol 2,3-dioxygenase